MTQKIVAALLPILFVILYLVPLSVRPLFDQDETRYAEVPREMIATVDWVVPRLNGLRYFEKPVLGYWLTAISLKTFGENNFAVRLPSALATGIVALLIFLLCSSCYGREAELRWLAVLVYLTSLGVTAIGTFAVLDPPLALFLTATLTTFFLASEEQPHSTRERILLFVAGLLVGCAFLTKGFLAFAVPVLAVGPYLLAQGRWRDTLRMLWLPLVGAVLISLPWAILIHQREPDFWNYFFWTEHVRRFFSQSAQHTQPFWFFLAVLPAMFMPWTLLLPAACTGLWKLQKPAGPQTRLIVFCLCWFFFPFLFFSASNGKLVTYILPCFPPLAILTAIGLMSNRQNIKAKSVQYGIISLAALAIGACIVLTGSQLLGPETLHLYDQPGKWIVLAGSLALMFLLLVVSMKVTRDRQLVLYALSFSLVLFTAPFAMPTMTLNMKAPGPLMQRNLAHISPDTTVLVGEENIRAVCWYLKRDDILIIEKAGELQYGVNYGEAKQRFLSPAATGDFVRQHKGKAVIIATHKEYSKWQPFLPAPVSLDSNSKNGFLVAYY